MTIQWDEDVVGFVQALDAHDGMAIRNHAEKMFAWLQGDPDPTQRDALFDRMMLILPTPDSAVWTLTVALVGYVSRTQEQVAHLAQVLVDMIVSKAPQSIDFAQDVTTAFEGYDPDESTQSEPEILQALMQQKPEAGAAWTCLSRVVDQMTLLMSIEREFLRKYRDEGVLHKTLEPLAQIHALSRQAIDLMDMLDDVTVMVCMPNNSIGFELKVDGVVDLPQFHALLIDTLAPHLGHDPLEDDARGIVDGTGPGFTGAWVQGLWSFWNERMLKQSDNLPDVLNEANTSMHLPTNGSVRQLQHINTPDQKMVIVCLGPSALFESWTLQRAQLALQASMTVVRTLDGDALRAFVEQL